jgi:hypothetical protein
MGEEAARQVAVEGASAVASNDAHDMRTVTSVDRAAWSTIAGGLIVVGVVLTAAAAAAFVKSGDLFVLSGVIASIFASLLGAFMVFAMPYEVSCSSQLLAMRLVFRTEAVPWESVAWYRPIAVNASLTPGEAGIWTIVRYRSGKRSRVALLYARGRGPGFGGVSDYETDLDLCAPTKRLPQRQ